MKGIKKSTIKLFKKNYVANKWVTWYLMDDYYWLNGLKLIIKKYN